MRARVYLNEIRERERTSEDAGRCGSYTCAYIGRYIYIFFLWEEENTFCWVYGSGGSNCAIFWDQSGF